MNLYRRIALGAKGNGVLIVVLVVFSLLAFALLYLAGHEKMSEAAATLRAVSQLIVSAIVVPVLLKLWFWSGIHSLFLKSLSVHRTLHTLGFNALLPDPEYTWPDILSAKANARFVLIAVAGQPLNADAVRACVEAIAKVEGSTITICIRDPSAHKKGSFAPRELLAGQVQYVRDFIKQLQAAKHPTCTIKLGWVQCELKYTLILGTEYGVYVPHPSNQEENKSGTMPRIVFSCRGDFYERFLQPDIDYITSNLKSFS